MQIADGKLAWTRQADSIAREKARDRIYVIRTPEPAEPLAAAVAVRAYKRLGNVEKAFRTFKGIDLRVRPLHHRLENRVRAHLCLCLLAYYVDWHMRTDLAKAKKIAKQSQSGIPLCPFKGLLESLSTLCANAYRIGPGPTAVRFLRATAASDHQKEIFRLLGVKRP